MLLRKSANQNLRQTQENSKSNHDKRVRFRPVFAPDDSVLIELPPLSTPPAERLTAEGDTNLLPKRLGPYCIISMGSEYVKIWQDGIKNKVLINLMTRAPRVNEDKTNNIPNKTSGESMKTNLTNPRKKPGKNTWSNKKSTIRRTKIEYATAFDGIAKNLRTTRTNLRHISRRTSSIDTGTR